MYRGNENRKRCSLLNEVTQKDPRNIENIKIKTTGKKQIDHLHRMRCDKMISVNDAENTNHFIL